MIKLRSEIDKIPAVVWGDESQRVIVAVHGNMSNKEDTVIRMLAEEAVQRGCQVLSFDLPEHGERKNDGIPCKVQLCVKDLRKIMEFAKSRWSQISLFANSMGAYFSLLEYKDEPLRQALFLSPVVDMGRIIDNMMTWFQISADQLEREREIETPIGQTLYWDYYCYVKDHPVEKWACPTSILYGEKDDLCERDAIESFVRRYDCRLEISKTGEHFFHTPEQLKAFQGWLKQEMD